MVTGIHAGTVPFDPELIEAVLNADSHGFFFHDADIFPPVFASLA